MSNGNSINNMPVLNKMMRKQSSVGGQLEAIYCFGCNLDLKISLH